MEQHYKLYLEVLVLCVIYSLRVLSKLSVDLTTLYIFFQKKGYQISTDYYLSSS